MGTMKDSKDKFFGNAKEKIGEITNNDELKAKGQVQKSEAQEHIQQRKERIDELETLHAEREAQIQDATKAHKGRTLADLNKEVEPEEVRDKDRLERERLKHYTGIEDKL